MLASKSFSDEIKISLKLGPNSHLKRLSLLCCVHNKALLQSTAVVGKVYLRR
jgi:hypothetical protein